MRSWVLLQNLIAFHSSTLIKHSEQLPRGCDSAAKNAAATTMSMILVMRVRAWNAYKRSFYEGGEGKKWSCWNRINCSVGYVQRLVFLHEVRIKYSCQYFGSVYICMTVREVSGAMPPSPSKVGRPGLPLSPRFRWPCVVSVLTRQC